MQDLPSNVNMLRPVPTIPFTVTRAYAGGDSADPSRHSTVVLDVHAAVLHTALPSTDVGDRLAAAKLRPDNVTLTLEDDPMLAGAAADTAGAVKEKQKPSCNLVTMCDEPVSSCRQS